MIFNARSVCVGRVDLVELCIYGWCSLCQSYIRVLLHFLNLVLVYTFFCRYVKSQHTM